MSAGTFVCNRGQIWVSTFILAHPPLDRQSISLVAAFATTEDEKEAIFASLPLRSKVVGFFSAFR